jgi:hypothetical protein
VLIGPEFPDGRLEVCDRAAGALDES